MRKKKYIYYNNRVMTKTRFITILSMWFTPTTGGHLFAESVSQTDLIIRTILMLCHLLIYLKLVINILLLTLKSHITRTTVPQTVLGFIMSENYAVFNHHASTIHVPAQCSCTYVCRHPVCNATYHAEFCEVIGISCTVPEFTCISGYLRQIM
jgi:hypothetical protein